VLRNAFSDRWDGHEAEIDAAAAQELAAANTAGDYRIAPVNAGQGVGSIDGVRPAAELIEQLCTDASHLLARSYD